MTVAKAPPRTVFDCMVFLRGFARGSSPSGQCLTLAENGALRLFLTAHVLAEVNDVLRRPKIQQRFPSLTEETIRLALQMVLYNAEFVTESRGSSITGAIRRTSRI